MVFWDTHSQAFKCTSVFTNMQA